MNVIADKNNTNLKIENERVNKNLRNCFNCWIYLMVVIVFVVFMMMIIFMKLFPKRKYNSHSSTSSNVFPDYTTFSNSSSPLKSYEL